MMKQKHKLLALALALVFVMGTWTSLVLADDAATPPPQENTEDVNRAGEGKILITIKYVYADDESIQAGQTQTLQIALGSEGETTIDSPAVEGYTPDQSSVTIKYKDYTQDTEIIVRYRPNTVKYETKHYLQNVNQTEYEFKETVEKEAPVGSEVTAEPIAYPGFTPVEPLQKDTIPAKGTLQLEVKYTRNSYTLTFDTDGGSTIEAQERLFDEPLTAPTPPTKEGYKFMGWQPELPANMPAADLTVKAQWELNEGALYKYAYYLQNADDDEYTKLGLVDAFGKAGDLVQIPQRGHGLENLNLFPLNNTAYEDYGIPKVVEDQAGFEKFFVFEEQKTLEANANTRISATEIIEVPLYFSRRVYTVVIGNNPSNFDNQEAWFPEISINGKHYDRNNPYTFTVRFGEDYTDRMVLAANITNIPDGYAYDRPLYVKGGRGYGSWFSSKPPYRFTAHMAYCAPQDLVNLGPVVNPYSQYFGLAIASAKNKLDVYEHFQGLDGEYQELAAPTRTEGLIESNWYYPVSQRPGFVPDLDKIDYYEHPSGDRGYSFVIRRNGQYSLGPGTKIYDKDWKNLKETITTAYPSDVDGRVDLYYKRDSYPVTFWIDPAHESKDLAKWVIYEGLISSALPTEEEIQARKPSTLAPNYEFQGWYLDQAFTQELSPDAKMETKPVQLFAKWGPAPVKVIVTIDPNNGEDVKTITLIAGNKISPDQLSTPAKEGYVFLGWYILEAQDNLTQKFDINREITESLRIKAKYRKDNTISSIVRYLDESGNAVAQADSYDDLPTGKDYTYQAKIVENMLPDARSKNLQSNSEPGLYEVVFTYSPFTTVNYTVNYVTRILDSDGQLIEEKALQPAKTVNTTYNVVTEDAADISGYVPLEKKITLPLSKNEAENVITFVYRKAEEPAPKEYTITFDANGGTLADGNTISSSTYVEGTSITIMAAPTRAGYRFLYWQGSEYHPGQAYTVTDNHTFTAIWEESSEPGEPTPPSPTPDQPGKPDDPDYPSYPNPNGSLIGPPRPDHLANAPLGPSRPDNLVVIPLGQSVTEGAKNMNYPNTAQIAQLPATGSVSPGFSVLFSLGLTLLGLVLKKRR